MLPSVKNIQPLSLSLVINFLVLVYHITQQ